MAAKRLCGSYTSRAARGKLNLRPLAGDGSWASVLSGRGRRSREKCDAPARTWTPCSNHLSGSSPSTRDRQRCIVLAYGRVWRCGVEDEQPHREGMLALGIPAPPLVGRLQFGETCRVCERGFKETMFVLIAYKRKSFLIFENLEFVSADLVPQPIRAFLSMIELRM